MNGNRQRGAKSGWVRREAKRIRSAFDPADRVQECLRRALEAERKAADGSDELRREMIDLAMQWRDLAEIALKAAEAARRED